MAANATSEQNDMACAANVTWHLYKLSPLFDFTMQTLNKHCSEFEGFLQKVAFNDFHKYNFSFYYNEEPGKKPDETDILYFIGKNKENLVVLNVSLHFKSRYNNYKDLTYFPFLLIEGKQILCEYFLTFLERQFFCLVIDVKLSTKDMFWLGLLSLNRDYGEEEDFSLLFTLPTEVRGSRSVLISIRADDAYRLMCSILQEEEDFSLGVKRFADTVWKYIKLYFKLNLSDCQLFEISSPGLVVYIDGDFKVLDADIVKSILHYFHQRLTDVELLPAAM